MQENYVERILKAKVYDVAIETPLEAGPAAVAPPEQSRVLQA
jgi:hypothetical protein